MKPEEALHLAVARYLDVALVPPTCWTSIDHGAGRLSKRAAGMAKARGVRAGLPDIFVFHGGRVVAIELKSATGRLSAVQREMAGTLMAAGVRCRLARSIEDVETILRAERIPLRATAGLRLARARAAA